MRSLKRKVLFTLEYPRILTYMYRVCLYIGVKVIVDYKALMMLVGTKMDYVEDDIKAEFVFVNPNEKVMIHCLFVS